MVSGVAASTVESIEVEYASGSSHTVRLGVSRAFVYRVPVAKIRAGDLPVTLFARDSSGTVIEAAPLNQ